MGWECPKCGRVYAPTVTECFTCNANPGAWRIEWQYPYVQTRTWAADATNMTTRYVTA